MQSCNGCGVEIAPGRLKALPDTKVCVECSSAKPKRPVTVTRGTGDNTYQETVILNHDEYKHIFKGEGKGETLN